MNPICRMFGHRPERGYTRSDTGYFRISGIAIDGMGVRHATLTSECRRCGVRYMIGKVHLPDDELKVARVLLADIVRAYRFQNDNMLVKAIEAAAP
jgi:hypothetical protein